MFKVGEKVRIKKNLRNIKNTVGVRYEMILMEGRIVTIVDAWVGRDDIYRYNISEDDEYWVWEDNLLEPVIDENLEKFIRSLICHTK